ncbi:MAG: SusC/RagA family TonB-linked outer membrane protein [Bacteroidota bacterium]
MKKLFFLLFIFSATLLSAQQTTITGNVTDQNGMGIPGVSILVKGTQQGTITDFNGDYTLTAPSEATLVFSFIGYKTVEEALGGRTVVNLQMQEEAIGMEEVVVVGYGTAKVKDVTGSIVTIRNEDLTKQQVTNVGQVLQGKVAGLQVSSTGEPGSSPQIRIRGLATVKGTNANPLYVVDDVFMDDISFLSNDQIESVSVLKDASAAAIYGVRGARGVVLITTKKGSSTEPKITYSGYYGIQNAANMLEMANAEQYITLYNEKNPTKPIDNVTYPGSTNWYNEVLRPANIQNHELGISGGNEASKYFYGIGITSQEGIIKKNDYTRFNLRGSNDLQINKYLKSGYNIIVTGTNTNLPADVLMPSFVAPPVFNVYTNNVFSDFSSLISGSNPAANLDRINNVSKSAQALVNAYLELKPIKDLSIRTSFTVDGNYTTARNYEPEFDYITVSDTVSTLTKTSSYHLNYTWDNLINYQKVFGENRLTLMAGFSAYQIYYQGMSGTADGVPFYSDATLYLGKGSTIPIANDWGGKIRSESYFARVFYSYKDKYLLTATFRRDGSSVFPENDRWATAPSVGIGWVISDESFMDNVNIFDFLKLKASWGVLGNSDIPQNVYTLTVNTSSDYWVIYGPYGSGNISQGKSITSVVPPQLMWESLEEINTGFESKLFANRMTLDIEYYRRMTKNAIFPYPVPATSGLSGSYLDNVCDILNTGVELTTSWNQNISSDMKIGFSGNVAYNHNEIYSFKPGTVGYTTGNAFNGKLAIKNQVGHPIGEYFVYEVAGVFQNADQVTNYVNSEGKKIMATAKPGDLIFVDQNDDGVIDELDKISYGSYIPKLIYGFNLNMTWKSFDLSADFAGVAGNKIYNAKRAQRYGNENWDLDFYENRWYGEGTSNTYPSANVGGRRNPDPSTFFVESGAYFRIRNVQVGYTLPSNLVNKLAISRARVYLSFQNPYAFFKYNGFSPEILSGSADTQGMDYNVYPITSISTIGLNLNF